jgi:divalent metal cation (Fe/Co/Zn/Cd) transporter
MDEAGNAHDGPGYRHNCRVSSALSGIPLDRRRRLAATIGLFAMLCVTIGIVALTGTTPGVVRVFSAVALIVAAFLGLVAWGVSRSVSIDMAEQRLDAAIDAAIEEIASHRPKHASDSCAHDGGGRDCAHSCDTCVLNDVLRTMRPSPTHTRAHRARTHRA